MKKNLVILTIIMVAGAAGWMVWRAATRPTGPRSVQQASPTPSSSEKTFYPNPDLEQEYEAEAQKILSDFEAGEPAGATRNRILALIVPDKYKNAHLELAIIFEKLMAGQASQDQSVIEDALEQLDALKQKQPRLTP